MSPRPPKKLQDLWYAKLKKAGFKDIEYDENHVKNWASGESRRHIRNSPNKNDNLVADARMAFQQSKQDYYRLAGFFLYDHEFANPTEQLIWKLHAEGTPMRDIVKAITKQRLKHRDLTTVKEIIHDLRKSMLKRYGENHEQE